LIVAAEVHERLRLDRLLFVPAADPPHKEATGATPEQRVRMLRAATAGDARFEVDELELARSGPSYTVDTLRAMRERDPAAERVFLLGVDQYRVLESWREPAEVTRLATLAVLARGGEHFEPDPRFPATAVPISRIDISSTAVRQRVQQGDSARYYVPEAVREIIEKEGIYR